MTDLRDPREAGPKPPFPAQHLERPELESEMIPRPDYGEDSYKGSDRLTDRVALITGGDSGIGRAIALAFAREGADVSVSYLEADEDARETVAIVEREGRRATALRGDVADEAWCKELVNARSRISVGSTFSSRTPQPRRCTTA